MEMEMISNSMSISFSIIRYPFLLLLQPISVFTFFISVFFSMIVSTLTLLSCYLLSELLAPMLKYCICIKERTINYMHTTHCWSDCYQSCLLHCRNVTNSLEYSCL